jgi:hypothetical protein
MASLMLQSRVADPAVLQDLLQGRNFRLLAFNGSAFLEHAPGLDREPKAPCRRYRMDGAAAVLLAKARTGSYRIDIADRPVPTELQQIAHACGIHASTETTTRQWVQAWLPLVQQCNQMSFPGVVSAYLNGQLVTAALHHADWLRVHRGLAFQLPALNHNTPDKASEDEAWTTYSWRTSLPHRQQPIHETQTQPDRRIPRRRPSVRHSAAAGHSSKRSATP